VQTTNARLIWIGLTYFALAEPGNAEAAAGIMLAHASHLVSVLVLYALSSEILDSVPKPPQAAFISAALHIFSPAGLFLSAPYAESPFALLQISGYYFYVRSRKHGTVGRSFSGNAEAVISGLLFGLSTTLRSNGLLNGILFAWDAIEYSIELLRYRLMVPALQKLAGVVTAGLLILTGAVLPQYIAHQEYCSVEPARPWCNKHIPSIYAWVQSHYW
jgi:phosphatidylinositol glycan class V